MSEKTFIEKLAALRQKSVNALLTMADGDSNGHARVRGHISGLDAAMSLFRQENKSDDDEESHTA
jgi:hypothetical protein